MDLSCRNCSLCPECETNDLGEYDFSPSVFLHLKRDKFCASFSKCLSLHKNMSCLNDFLYDFVNLPKNSMTQLTFSIYLSFKAEIMSGKMSTFTVMQQVKIEMLLWKEILV